MPHFGRPDFGGPDFTTEIRSNNEEAGETCLFAFFDIENRSASKGLAGT
ncbi:POU domain class 5 transcription factor 1 [Roseibium sp. TrichSKD4]|nr:POU domain class 5 transcription factor 1 [Roseibium sp. TrichSKD4]